MAEYGLQHFELTGSWAEKPQVWKNFVNHVSNHDWFLPHGATMERIHAKLAEFDLKLEGNILIGTPEAIMAWQLTYV
jgi:hypothetical protein